MKEFLEPNSYPDGVRGTLRDAVTYLFAAHLSDSSGWTAAESNEVYQLGLPSLLRSDSLARAVKVDDDAIHPLARMVAVLDDLEAWHASRSEREGALEARLERLRRLFAAFTEDEDRRTIEKDLEDRLPALASLPWFAMGKAQLAEFVERPDFSGDLVRARSIAEQGRKAYPASVGGQRCLAIIKQIEAPAYALRTMQNDGPGRRSIQVTHKNVERLVCRAFRFDLAARVESAHNQYAILPNNDEMRKIVDAQTPAAEWIRAASADSRLPPARDIHHAAHEGARGLRRRRVRRRELWRAGVSARRRALHPVRPRPRDAPRFRRHGRIELPRGPGALGRDRPAGPGCRDDRPADALEPGTHRARLLGHDRRGRTGAPFLRRRRGRAAAPSCSPVTAGIWAST